MPGKAERTPGADMEIPNVARMWDYYLGGSENSEADPDAARLVLGAAPDLPLAALENREFLKHAVRFLASESGISQFIDIGPGLPTRGNIHRLVQQYNRRARVVYVDNDPVVLARGRVYVDDIPEVILIEGDLRNAARPTRRTRPSTRPAPGECRPCAPALAPSRSGGIRARTTQRRCGMTSQWPLHSFLEFGALPGAVPCARLHTRQLLWEWGLAAITDSTELVVSELITNAIQASRATGLAAPVRLWLLSDKAQVLVLVWDTSPHPPVQAAISDETENGRGLLLVEAISQQ